MSGDTEWTWKLASDDRPIHELLCDSDSYHATMQAPAPMRNQGTTRKHILAGAVHALYQNGVLVGTFTLTETPPRGFCMDVFPKAPRAMYLQRLAVHPDWLERDALVGVCCVRRACEVARERKANVLRAEANPDINRVWRLLKVLGFEQIGPILEERGRRKAYLQRTLLPG